jgi:RND superfamily putative drug exporter
VFIAVSGGLFGSLSGKLADVQKNTNASFLSKTAESTRALTASGAFVPENSIPTVVLYERDGAITPADTARAVEDLTRVRKTDWLDGEPSAPVLSTDGKALQVFLPFNGDDSDLFIQHVKALRTDLARPGRPDGLRTYVTGLGGSSADLFEVFGSLDTTLLLGTGAIVILILLVVYRSPVLWLLPVIGAGLAYTIATGILYLLAKNDVLVVNGQSSGILTVLTFGAATDYALLLTSRYREELHRHERTWDAMKVAWRGAMPAIVASAATVILALLCLLFSELEGNKGLGPVAAIGIACAALVMLVLLPAMLLLGRWLFWPRIPRLDMQDPVHEGFWARVATFVERRSGILATATVVALLALAALTTGLKASGIPQNEALTSRPESVVGQEHLSRHFSAGTGSPVDVVGPADKAAALQAVVAKEKGVASVVPFTAGSGTPKLVKGTVLLEAVLGVPADSNEAKDIIRSLRSHLDVVSTDAIVGGFTAIDLDIREASQRDNKVIIPIVLLLIVLVLAVLLRSLVAPLILIASVVLSFAATLGACAFFFTHVFGYPGADTAFPLFTFVFLVALGVDYNIFLMTRVREEAVAYRTREGMLRGLTVTGGVITSAGVVLAATFTVLGTLPLVFLAEIGFAVALGVLLDTIVVRSLLVPAVVLRLGDRVWWPSALAQPSRRVSSSDSTTAPSTSATS